MAVKTSVSVRLYGFVAIFAIGLFILLVVTFSVLTGNVRGLDAIGETGRQALLVARMNTNVQAMSAAQFHMVADPSPDVVRDQAARIGQEAGLFRERIAAVRATASGPIAEGLTGLQQQFDSYLQTLSAVEAATRSGDRAAVMTAAREADKAAGSLRERARAIFAQADERATGVAVATKAAVASGMWGIGATAFVFIVAGAFLAHRIAHASIILPLRRAVAAIARLSGGDISSGIEDVGRGDEIGEVARGLEVFRQGLADRHRLREEQTAAAVAREKRAQAMEAAIHQFQQELAATVGQVSTSATDLRKTAGSLSDAAGQGERLATSVAAAAEQAAGNVGSVAAAAEQLSGSIREISSQIAKSHAIVEAAHQSVRHADGVIAELVECSQKIGEVVGMISAIADQTNLLALNATIAAARAGDAGKGFTVGAGEVKNLANQTARATGEVTEQITRVQAKTSEVVGAIRSVGDIVGEVGAMTTSVAGAVEEQSAATAEIARNVDQAAAGTSEVTRNIAGVREAASATGTEAGRVNEASAALDGNARRLHDDVGRFLGVIQAL
ncbi:MAG: HAMP domain-containing protein [Telmatospirillum sp.]|nr:HAMP domain-containing protein [Telmatospirillum sp.]